MTAELLLYGATGYTGELIAREAKARGVPVVLSGRSAGALAVLARELGVEYRAVGLENAPGLDHALSGMRAVLHCAGPFSQTSKPMADACLRGRVAYLDITGEIAVFEALAARDAEAKAAGVMLLPGCGFDVVPSDCLAGHVYRRLPQAKALTLAFLTHGGPSRGTSLTALEHLSEGALVRRGGKLTAVPNAWHSREIDFGEARAKAMTIPWGDVATAWYTTGIPDIEVLLAAPAALRWAARASGAFNWALRSKGFRSFVEARIRAGSPGPDADARARGSTVLWAEAREGDQTAVARLHAPDGYTATVRTTLAVVQRVLAGEAPSGFQTPCKAFGPNFVLGIEGFSRQDVSP